MAEESDLEKTEPASTKKLEKARENGDIPRSRELSNTVVLLAGGLGFMVLGYPIAQAMQQGLKQGLTFDIALAREPNLLMIHMVNVIENLLWAFAPMALIIIAAIVSAPILVGGWVMSPKSMAPNFNKLNPMKGLSNLFSKNALAELIKSIGKALIVGAVAYAVVLKDLQPMLALSHQPIQTAIGEVSDLMLYGFLSIVTALVMIAIIDVPFQLYQYAEKHKMTKQEIKDEHKESEGSPEIKARVRQQQREMARRRMMSQVPKADVIITNPTHYAVAVQYQEQGMRAPIVIAKGVDVLAQKIKAVGAEHHVMTLESPKLARALYAHTDLEKEIPQALYSAVAEILAYVFQLREFKQNGGVKPQKPSNVQVPDTLDPHYLLANKPSASDVGEL